MAGSDEGSAPVYLTLRDTQSSTFIEAEVTGTTFGRHGEGADIEIDNPAISSKHARIFRKRGKWWIEDLGSSNGTSVDGARIHEPVQLRLGARIELGRYAFEVSGLVEPSGARTASGSRGNEAVSDVDPDAVTAAHVETPSPSLATTNAAAAVAVTVPTPAVMEALPSDMPVTEAAVGLALTERANGLHATEPVAAAEKTVLAANATVRRRTAELHFLGRTHDPTLVYLTKTVPRAVLHYAIELPLFLINPPGRLREEITGERFTALSVRGLIAFAWGAALLSLMIGAVTIAVGSVVDGLFDPMALAGAAVTFAVATVVALVLHPTLAWVIETLGGESSSVSRTNFFIGILLGGPVFAVAGLGSVVAGRLSEPHATVVVAALTTIATLLLLYILFAWLRIFVVETWALVLLFVASALLFVGPASDVINAARKHVEQTEQAEIDLPAGQVTEIPP